MEKMIMQYLRDKYDNSCKGVVLALEVEGRWALGVSVANTAAGDHFDSKIGFEMARGRALKVLEQVRKNISNFDGLRVEIEAKMDTLKDRLVTAKTVEDQKSIQKELDIALKAYTKPCTDICVEVPIGVYDQVAMFYERAHRYFKDKDSACHIEQNFVKINMEKTVAQLSALFETEEERMARESVPSSLRQPITAQEIITMQQLGKALESLDIKKIGFANQPRTWGGKVAKPAKQVTRVKT